MERYRRDPLSWDVAVEFALSTWQLKSVCRIRDLAGTFGFHDAVRPGLASLLPSRQDGSVLHQECGSPIGNRAQVRFVK